MAEAVLRPVVVAHEITRDLSKPGAEAQGTGPAEGHKPGSKSPVRVEETETGRFYAAVVEARPDDRLGKGGETATLERRAVIVPYGNERVPTIVPDQSLDADIDVLTTRAFLEGLEPRKRSTRSDAPDIGGSG
jgi:hypothetical protein